MTAAQISGVFCAAATPVRTDLGLDAPLFADHCRKLIAQGCDGVALLGSTGEANSFSRAERAQILDTALSAGLRPDQLLPGTGTPAIPDTVALTQDALDRGISTVIMLPPFYYKGVSEDGLFAAYAEVLERLGDSRLRVLLYHIPQISGVALPLAVIARLVAAYPQTVIGIKDSGGDLAHMEALLAHLPGFAVFSGADPLMLPLLQRGGAGCITATSNLVADSLRLVFDHFADPGRSAEVAAAQARIIAYRELSNSFAQIPTIKAMIALQSGAPGWRNLRPPLLALTEAELDRLRPAFLALGQA